MAEDRRANYALATFNEHLGPDEESLDVPWAEFVGDRTDEWEFTVGTAEPADAYVQLQVYEANAYGHEILVNGDPLSGFDIPPHSGWQVWMDTVTGTDLVRGENTLRLRRDTDTGDAFVVGTVTVHWTESVG